jgi:hypothetical protein
MRSFQSDVLMLFGQPVAENPTVVMIEASMRALEYSPTSRQRSAVPLLKADG